MRGSKGHSSQEPSHSTNKSDQEHDSEPAANCGEGD